MSALNRSSTRWAVPAGVGLAMLLTVGMTGLAGAHGGDPAKVHACVVAANGTIRVVEPTESCRSNESSLDWSLNGGATYTAGFGLALNGNQFSVIGAPWGGLSGVPAGFADGTDDDGSSLVAQLRNDLTTSGSGVVDGSSIMSGTITATALAGSDDALQTVVGAVTSEKIADGTIANRDVAAGAITTDRQKVNAESVSNPAATSLINGTQTRVVSTILMVPSSTGGATNHAVLLTGQGTLDCTGCTAPVAVTYTIGSAGVLLSPVMSATVDSAEGDIVLPVSFLTHVTGGEKTFDLLVTASGFGSGSATVRSATLNAIDLGRAR